MSLTERFKAVAVGEPGRVAVRFAGGVWMYGELIERSGDLARSLVGQGVRPGEVVAVTAERGPELVAILLGILEAGAAFLILDPAHPESRRQECLRQARPG